jgi:small-conductance mechanosensitive channel
MKILLFIILVIQFNVLSQTSNNILSTSIDSTVTKTNINDSSGVLSTKNLTKGLEPPSVLDVISIGKIIWAVIFFIIGIYLIKLFTKILDVFAEKSTSYRITIKGIVPIVRIFGWIIIIYIIIAGIFKPPIETIIAVTASVGIAIGFAAQDVIKNIFGGIMILFDRPFLVGDKIQVGDFYGEVIKIGLISTRVVTPDDSMVTIPNSEVMNKSVSNSNSGEPNCQVVAEIYLPVDINTDVVRQLAIEAAQVSRYVYLNKPVTVLFFNEIKDRKAYLKMRLKAYVMDIRFEFQFKSDMTEIVMQELLTRKIISTEDYN